MQAHLISYLRDHRDQIIENWLTEAELPAAGKQEPETASAGRLPYEFLSQAFDSVLTIIETRRVCSPASGVMHLSDFIGVTCSCKAQRYGGRVCMELHDSGLNAFMSVFDKDWDANHEFDDMDRAKFHELINHALYGFIGQQIDDCRMKQVDCDCPFAAMPKRYKDPGS